MLFSDTCHWTLSWARQIQFITFHSFLRLISLLLYIRVGIQRCHYSSGLSGQKCIHNFDVDHVLFGLVWFCATCPTHYILHDSLILIILSEEPQSHSSSLGSFLLFPVTSSQFQLFVLSNTLDPHTSLSARETIFRQLLYYVHCHLPPYLSLFIFGL